MQLNGKHMINAEPSAIWAKLMDIESLAKLVPGVSRLEKISENNFKSVLDIKMGPVSGSFSGSLQIEDIIPQRGYTLRVQQNSKIGNAQAAMKIKLAPFGANQTEIDFDGDVKLSGLLASMGQRLLGSASNSLVKQFFTNLEKEMGVTTEANPAPGP